MKRVVAMVAVVVMLVGVVGIANAEDFVNAFSKSIGGADAAYNLGNMLLIICDYDKLMNADANNMGNLTEQYKDSILNFEKILILCMKDNEIYLGIEMPLADGVFIENTGNALMSRKYLLENMRIGN